METKVNAQSNAQPIIEVQDLVRNYGKFTAVNHLDFDVHQGEIFGLLGTNGAGKTSTLEILEGLALADEGQVKVFGLDPRKDRVQIRPHQGVMMQSGGFPTDLTVKETLAMWAGTLTKPRDVAQTLEVVDLAHRSDVQVKNLSGGEVRRLDFACTIIGNPQLLFLDEPTTGLDAESRHASWRLIEELNADGATVVLTTHYLEEADKLCDRLLIMHEGKLATIGTHAEVIAGYPATISMRSRPELYQQLPGRVRQNMYEDDGRLLWKTQHLQRDLTELLQWAEREGVELENLNAAEANLETVFLDIAGVQI